MASNGSGRKRWTAQRAVKEPSLYDEWLKQEKSSIRTPSPRRQSVPGRHGDTTPSVAASAGRTIRAVTPDPNVDAGTSIDSGDDDLSIGPGQGVSSSEGQTTTPMSSNVGSIGDDPIPNAAPKSKKLVKGRNGSTVAGLLARNISKGNGNRAQEASDAKSVSKSSRSRAKTLGDKRSERSTRHVSSQNRDRTSSMNTPPVPSAGAEYLASVPAETSPPSIPSIKSVDRSLSPDSSSANDSKRSSERSSSARRILHLMKTLNGRYSGSVLIRRDASDPWTQIYCYIREDTGDLVYEPRGPDTTHRTLVSGLKGCVIRPNIDGDTPYLEVSLPQSGAEIHLKLLTQVDFDSWYAALLYWQSFGTRERRSLNAGRPSTSTSDTARVPDVPPRASSARKRRDRTGKSRKEGKASPMQVSVDVPVIKAGKMIYWDVGFASETVANGRESNIAADRPNLHRTHSHRLRRGIWIKGQLRENGELELRSDNDNVLVSVVQLSQLSRCAIQRLDPSVMDDEFCIAVYPQYTSIPSDTEATIIRPMFLSLEDRVLFEVWFVLLRAFTIPQLYGPRITSEAGGEVTDVDTSQDLENMLATSTTDMFRMERSLSIKVMDAKIHPAIATPVLSEAGSSSSHGKSPYPSLAKSEQYGFYAEVLLDNEIRGRTAVKHSALPSWGESFDYSDLPPVLSSASIVVKRRARDAHNRENQESKHSHEALGSTNGQLGPLFSHGSDVVCGKVEIYLHELEDEREQEKWWPIFNNDDQPVGEMLIKARAIEGVILMARDYQPLSDILHRFSNSITLQIAQILWGDLKRVGDCLLDIYQVSGKVSDWMMALAEEEIDGIHKETPVAKLRFDRRVASDGSHEDSGTGKRPADRELIVRDMNKTATFEANLLFRGNTLLTKALDSHMRRVGKEYLEQSLGAKLRVINSKDPECEVDPSKVESGGDLSRNWRRLLLCTQEVWKSILDARHGCPIELRLIFRHIRACAEDRYGDFLRSVSYSSVSGFLFLRFFCPAILGPQLFGLVEDDIKPHARRAFILIAKSLQTLSNMASFGSKETWMEPMNAFLKQNRADFKSFVDDICYVPTPLTAATTFADTEANPSAFPLEVISAESNLSYATPMTVMQRLPPTSREGFPSLPFLIDQPRAYAELVEMWLGAVKPSSGASTTSKSEAEITAVLKSAGGELLAFHEVCINLHRRTQDCLSRAERAERPNSATSFKWDELIDQLQTDGSGNELTNVDDGAVVPNQTPLNLLAGDFIKDPSIAQTPPQKKSASTRERDVLPPDGDGFRGGKQSKTAPSNFRPRATSDFMKSAERPGSSGLIGSLRDGLRRAQLQSRGSDSTSASVSNVSSAVSSDTEHTTDTTALPNYERELRHRQRREAAKQQIKEHVEAARVRETEKEKRKVRAPIVSALRKKNQRESKNNASEGYTNYGL